MVKKYFVLREEFLDVFYKKIYIPTIGKLPFYLDHIGIIGSIECGDNRNYFLHDHASKKKKS